MPALADVAREKLQELESNARRRELKAITRGENALVSKNGEQFISFSCNDYLGLSQHEKVKEAAIYATKLYGIGSGASRLVTGNYPLYGELERRLAKWKGFEAALIFGSGYLANIGVIPALASKDDLIIADKLVHACLLDGAKLSDAKLLRFKHNDVDDCERLLRTHRSKHKHAFIITDEVFSMDGDLAPLMALSDLAHKHDTWLMADGAHSMQKPIASVDIYIGTLSKAFGSYGGYVCAQKEVIDYLISHARSFMFSTALPPSVIASSLAALDIIEGNPELTLKAIRNAKIFTRALNLPEAESTIVPLILGDEKKAIEAASSLQEAGYLTVAIRPPTVPEGTARLRFAFSALHKEEDILKMADFIKKNIIFEKGDC